MRTKTDQYEAAYGRKPKGYGMWGLDVTFTNGRGAFSSETVFATGTLTDAKREAVATVREMCAEAKTIVEIEVMP